MEQKLDFFNDNYSVATCFFLVQKNFFKIIQLAKNPLFMRKIQILSTLLTLQLQKLKKQKYAQN